MMPTVFIMLILTILSPSRAKMEFLSEEFIAEINTKQKTWIAGRNFPEDTSVNSLKKLLGSLEEPAHHTLPVMVYEVFPETIPQSFDSRSKWPQCDITISNIRNQGGCGSCWAFSAVEVMTDRLCIASNGTQKIKFSPEDVITCCEQCGDCDGGLPSQAFTYWVESGLVSGGDYDSNEGCLPYQEDPFKKGITPVCSPTCLNTNYGTAYKQDKHFGSTAYAIKAHQIEQMQTDIMENGPLTACFIVYSDFYNYKSGVYVHTAGDIMGAHAVKIVGWSTEDGTPYWLIANSWGADWGNLEGFFKILRGEDHCHIESTIYAGTAKL